MSEKFEITEIAYQQALAKSKNVPRNPWQLDSVEYDKTRKRIILVFPRAVGFAIPVALVDELANAKDKDLEKIHLTPSGETLVVEGVDAYISTKGLIEDILGSIPKEIIAARFGSIGGSRTSTVKKSSSAENGRKGGRPKKQSPAEEHALV